MSKKISQKLPINALITLLTQSMAGSADPAKASPFAHALHQFISPHGAYGGGYLLCHLGMARWLWDRPGIPGMLFTPGTEGLVSIDIDILDHDLMDMTITIPVPDNIPLRGHVFDHRYTREERAIYLMFHSEHHH